MEELSLHKKKKKMMKNCYRVLVVSSVRKQVGVNENSTCNVCRLEKVAIFHYLKELSFAD